MLLDLLVFVYASKAALQGIPDVQVLSAVYKKSILDELSFWSDGYFRQRTRLARA